ncbi:MAG: diguanylate cyclase [Thermoguttaceae bacterium]|jgi:diguanylate cyclase
MLTFLADFAIAVVMASAGVVAGWWLRQRTPAVEADGGAAGRTAREVLQRLHEVALHMAANVGQHSTRVEEINQELAAVDAQDPETVISTVTRLIEANRDMQQQLTTAEDRLQEQSRLVETWVAQALSDALTGIANRRALDDDLRRRVGEFQRYQRNVSLLLGDIDHFKRVNDTYGHQAGDEVLRGVARVLSAAARTVDLVARYGGEEFAVVLPETCTEAAVATADRLRQAVEAARFQSGGKELNVTISFGAATLLKGEEVAQWIERSDSAMYAAKQNGRNRCYSHDGRMLCPYHPAQEQQQPPGPPQPATAAETAAAAADPAGAAESGAGAVAVMHPREHARPLASRSEFCIGVGRRLAEWRRGGAAPAVLLVRIDDYAGLISRHGRRSASLVLRATAQFLNAAIRDMDVAAEYSDATFAMLLPGAGMASVIGIAERLRQAIARCTLPLPEGNFSFTISVAGAVTFKNDEPQTLLWRAEEALDTAGASGGNTAYFHNGQWAETMAAALERAGAGS